MQAVKHFQRQNELAQDGIVGNSTWDAIMSPDAKYYAVSEGNPGRRYSRIQQRLYELQDICDSGSGDRKLRQSTEAAVFKLRK